MIVKPKPESRREAIDRANRMQRTAGQYQRVLQDMCADRPPDGCVSVVDPTDGWRYDLTLYRSTAPDGGLLLMTVWSDPRFPQRAGTTVLSTLDTLLDADWCRRWPVRHWGTLGTLRTRYQEVVRAPTTTEEPTT